MLAWCKGAHVKFLGRKPELLAFLGMEAAGQSAASFAIAGGRQARIRRVPREQVDLEAAFVPV